jgi:hypothetical protein
MLLKMTKEDKIMHYTFSIPPGTRVVNFHKMIQSSNLSDL